MNRLFNHPYWWVFKRFAHIVQRSNQASASLSFTTLFAVVPMLTVIYAVLSSVPYFHGVDKQLQTLIFNNLMPESAAVVEKYLVKFVTKASHLTWWGVGFLAVTSMMMLMEVEYHFNRIWHVENSRRMIKSVLIYWLLISVGPLLVGMGLMLSSYVNSLKLFSGASDFLPTKTLLSWLPALLNALAFTLIYKVVPHGKVQFRHALMGGACVALVFEITKIVFTQVIAHSSYNLIYGAFAAVPAFLLWIYITWLIILLGAELVHALPMMTSTKGLSE